MGGEDAAPIVTAQGWIVAVTVWAVTMRRSTYAVVVKLLLLLLLLLLLRFQPASCDSMRSPSTSNYRLVSSGRITSIARSNRRNTASAAAAGEK